MRFYTTQHQFSCGIDLHARSMYVGILDAAGTIVFHKDLPTTPEHFLRAVAPSRAHVVVAVEHIFTWYWLADLCSREAIPFILGHALYMKVIHGGKAKNRRTTRSTHTRSPCCSAGACSPWPMRAPMTF